eukprot:2506811-Rhodomonas_salina.1
MLLSVVGCMHHVWVLRQHTERGAIWRCEQRALVLRQRGAMATGAGEPVGGAAGPERVDAAPDDSRALHDGEAQDRERRPRGPQGRDPPAQERGGQRGWRLDLMWHQVHGPACVVVRMHAPAFPSTRCGP